jgi:type II secretion system protein H
MIPASHSPRQVEKRGRRGAGFTLVEIMVVVAIMGIILMTGVPPFVRVMRQEGMRKALKDVVDCCERARIEAVTSGKPAPLIIRPLDRTVRGGKKTDGMIPRDVTILSVGVNFVEYGREEEARALFYPTGISDEMEITLQDNEGSVRQINLDIVTGEPVITTIR